MPLCSLPQCGKIPHILLLNSLCSIKYWKSFSGWAFTTKLLNIPRFLSLPHVAVTYWGRLRVNEYVFQCRPNLISGSEYGTVFPATADGITFSWATKTGKLRPILSKFTLQYVLIPKLSGEKREMASAAQSLEIWEVFNSAKSGDTPKGKITCVHMQPCRGALFLF